MYVVLCCAILILSTCTSDESVRFVVAAKLVQP